MPGDLSLDTAIETLLRRIIREEFFLLKAETVSEDRFLESKEAAELLSVSPDWLYRNAKKLPFSRKLGSKMLRFSYQGIQKYLANRKLG